MTMTDANAIANILTPLSVIIVAVLAYLRSKNTQKKLEHITVVVNQRYTDLENYVIALKKDIVASGRKVPDDQSKG
jgi:predicted MarR family transcription regulator